MARRPSAATLLHDRVMPARQRRGATDMRPAPATFSVFTTQASAVAARQAEFLAMIQRPDATPLPDDAEGDADRGGWLSLASRRLARRRPAARARRAF